jgi:hypothetical protein
MTWDLQLSVLNHYRWNKENFSRSSNCGKYKLTIESPLW